MEDLNEYQKKILAVADALIAQEGIIDAYGKRLIRLAVVSGVEFGARYERDRLIPHIEDYRDLLQQMARKTH